MAETALEVIKGIITEQGGTSDAETIVPALEDLGEVIAAGGGSGSGGGGKLVKVTFSQSGSGATADKTNKELYDLHSEGALIYFDFAGMITTNYFFVMQSSGAYTVEILALFSSGTSLGAFKLKSADTSASNTAYTMTQLS